MPRTTSRSANIVFLLFAITLPTVAHADGVSLEPASEAARSRLGKALSGELRFTDHEGREIELSSLLGGDRPVLLTMNYFRCNSLCDLQLATFAKLLPQLASDLPQGLRVVTVSFDPRDTPDDARKKRRTFVEKSSEPLEWTYLVGAPETVETLAAELGFHFRYDSRSDHYAHEPVSYVLTPEGIVSRYLVAIGANPMDVRLALAEASSGKVATTLERVLLTCFRYDEHTGRYSVFVLGLIRILGACTVCGLVVGFVVLRRRERRRQDA